MNLRFRGSLFGAALLLVAGAASADTNHWRGLAPVSSPKAFLQSLAPADLHFEELSAEHFGDGDRIVHYGARYRGLPVLGASAAVRLDAGGRARAVSHPRVDTWPDDVTPALSREAARDQLQGLSRWPLQNTHVHLGIFLRFGEARLAWFGFPTIPGGVPSRLRFVLDAHTGKVIEAVDLARSVTAQMYETNPVKSPNLETLPLPLPETGGSLIGTYLLAKNCVDKKTVKELFNGQFKVHVCDLVSSATPDATGNYSLVPNDTDVTLKQEDPFSQLSMYYHAARAYAFYQDLQGDPAAQVTKAEPLTAVANLRIAEGSGFDGSGDFDQSKAQDPDLPLRGFDNAFFSPAAPEGSFDPYGEILGVTGGGMFFGQGSEQGGGRDYAYDGDVVYHEFTHAVVDKTLQLGQFAFDENGVSASPSAMNEGLADFFSSSISGDPNLGEYAGSAIHQGGASSIRSMVNDDTCPASVIGEAHADSTLFSGGLWEARATLSTADQKTFLQSMYKTMRATVSETPTYEELAQLFIEGLQTDLPAGAAALTTSMTAKGVLPKCTRVIDQPDDDAVTANGSYPLFAAPGRQSTGLERVPGIIQVHRKLTPGAKVSVEVSHLFTGRSGFGGGQNSSFEPKLEVRFGSPLKWTVARTPKATADVQEFPLVADEGSSDNSVDLTVPDGATDVFVQVLNAGDLDGVYDSLGVTVTAPHSTPDGGATHRDAGASGGTALPVSDAGADGANETPATVEGCGCHGAPASDVGGNAALLSVLAAGYAVARRRRRQS